MRTVVTNYVEDWHGEPGLGEVELFSVDIRLNEEKQVGGVQFLGHVLTVDKSM